MSKLDPEKVAREAIAKPTGLSPDQFCALPHDVALTRAGMLAVLKESAEMYDYWSTHGYDAFESKYGAHDRASWFRARIAELEAEGE